MCPLQDNLLSVTFDPETADATFGGHYVATVKVQTSLVIIIYYYYFICLRHISP